MKAAEMVSRALRAHTVIPALNIPHLPMLKAVVQAVADEDSVAMIQVARLEWEKFEAKSLEDVAAEYAKYALPAHTLLHLDHTPVIDEDGKRVDWAPIHRRAIAAGYQSVMIDGSRLSFAENAEETRKACQIAHEAGIACEAELGSVLGHESQAVSYQEVFEKKIGFTDPDQARQFVEETKCDWLSVAVGSVHGAIAGNLKDQKKPAAQVDEQRVRAIQEVTGIPLVLHGGSGIPAESIRLGVYNGIAKINVGTEIRQAYEAKLRETNDIEAAREATYLRTREVLRQFLCVSGNAKRLRSVEE